MPSSLRPHRHRAPRYTASHDPFDAFAPRHTPQDSRDAREIAQADAKIAAWCVLAIGLLGFVVALSGFPAGWLLVGLAASIGLSQIGHRGR